MTASTLLSPSTTLTHAWPAEAVQVGGQSVGLSALERDLRSRALARIGAGTVLLVGFVTLFATIAREQSTSLPVFGASWIAAVLVYGVTRLWTRFVSRPVARLPDAWFGKSFAVIGVGLGLLLPLSLHAVFSVFSGGRSEDFAKWVWASFGLVGIAHIALAWMLARRAVQLSDGEQPITLGGVYLRTVGWSCVPGVLCFGVPPIIVAVTGLFVLPFLAVYDAVIVRERWQRVSQLT